MVSAVDLEIRQGEVVGLLGPNGAGKTTTFYMVVGLARPDSGQVFLGDEDITALPMYLRARAGIGYLPQEASVFRKLTAEENVRAILEMLGLPGGGAAAPGAGPPRGAGDRGHGRASPRTPSPGASGGGWRSAGPSRPRRPSSCSTSRSRGSIPSRCIDIQRIISHLKARGIGVLITDHNVRETLKITDRAYILRDGHVFRSGTPRSLASDPDVRRVYLGEAFQLDDDAAN